MHKEKGENERKNGIDKRKRKERDGPENKIALKIRTYGAVT